MCHHSSPPHISPSHSSYFNGTERPVARILKQTSSRSSDTNVCSRTAPRDLWHSPQTVNQATGLWWLKQTAALCQQGHGMLLTQMLWTVTDRRQEHCHSSCRWGVWGAVKGPHWVEIVLYLQHTSCYCNTAQTRHHFVLSEMNLDTQGIDEVSVQRKTFSSCSLRFLIPCFNSMHIPVKKGQSRLYSFFKSWCIIIESEDCITHSQPVVWWQKLTN